jgi:hypothetical protein
MAGTTMTGATMTGATMTGATATDPAAPGLAPAAGRGAVSLRTRPADPHQAVRTGEGTGTRAGRSTRSGRRPQAGRRSKRLILIAGAAVLVLGAGTVGVMVLKPHGGGPAHVVAVQPKLGDFTRKPELEQQLNASQIRQQVIAKSSGQARNVVSAVYENDASAAGGSGSSPQILLFIGGNLSGVSPDGFVAGFSGQFKSAQTVSAGSMGGSASCVAAKTAGEVSLCAWADNDTFGVVASPTMSVAQLSAQMRTIRPLVERPAPHKPA